MQRGIVRWFSADRGYGFIDSTDGDVFASWRVVDGPHEPGAVNLRVGDEVDYEVERTDRGLRATRVVLLGSPITLPSLSGRVDALEARVTTLESGGNCGGNPAYGGDDAATPR